VGTARLRDSASEPTRYPLGGSDFMMRSATAGHGFPQTKRRDVTIAALTLGETKAARKVEFRNPKFRNS
jgi:hypothetical protein